MQPGKQSGLCPQSCHEQCWQPDAGALLHLFVPRTWQLLHGPQAHHSLSIGGSGCPPTTARDVQKAGSHHRSHRSLLLLLTTACTCGPQRCRRWRYGCMCTWQ